MAAVLNTDTTNENTATNRSLPPGSKWSERAETSRVDGGAGEQGSGELVYWLRVRSGPRSINAYRYTLLMASAGRWLPRRGMRPFSLLLLRYRWQLVVTLMMLLKNAVGGVHVHKFSNNPRFKKNTLIRHRTPMGG